jgi:tetratricopeptide (TPR) repeat protein
MDRGPLAAMTALAALALAWGAPLPAVADQDDPRLAGLFERLEAAADAETARIIEGRIWAIWIESDDAEVTRLMHEGIAAMTAGDYDLALERFDRAVARAPRFAEAWNKRATVFYLMGDYEASVRDIERTLNLEPHHFGALSGLGLIYTAIDRPAAAIRSFEAALAIHPHLEGTRRQVEALRRQMRGSRT